MGEPEENSLPHAPRPVQTVVGLGGFFDAYYTVSKLIWLKRLLRKKHMKPFTLSKKRFIVAASIATIVIVAVYLGSYLMRQNYESHHYVTLTIEDNKGRITHERVSQQRLDQINRDANKIMRDATKQVDRERKQKGLSPLRALPHQ